MCSASRLARRTYVWNCRSICRFSPNVLIISLFHFFCLHVVLVFVFRYLFYMRLIFLAVFADSCHKESTEIGETTVYISRGKGGVRAGTTACMHASVIKHRVFPSLSRQTSPTTCNMPISCDHFLFLTKQISFKKTPLVITIPLFPNLRFF
jgi:hypothetical protein